MDSSETLRRDPKQKRLCTGCFEQADDAVVEGLTIHKCSHSNCVIEKVNEFAARLNVGGFDPSSGWLHHFQACYRNVWKQLCSGASSVDNALAGT